MSNPNERILIDHIVPVDVPQNQLLVRSFDPPGPGGAHHDYQIVGPGYATIPLQFQKGPIAEYGVNGITNEALLAIIIDRLRCFQSGPFSCRENALALTKCEEALMWLQKRTVDRVRRNVEGKNEK